MPKSDTQFKKGVSGNPSGRKKMPTDIKEMLKGATPDACRLLCETINNEDAKLDLRIRCSEIVLDRVFGKPQQSVQATSLTVNAEPTQSLAESIALVRELLSDG